MFFDFLSSYGFRRNFSVGLHCHCKIVTWMFLDLVELLPFSFLLLLLFYVFQNHLDKLYTCEGDDPPSFCLCLFLKKLSKAAIFSSQKERTIYDCHLLECDIYTFQEKSKAIKSLIFAKKFKKQIRSPPLRLHQQTRFFDSASARNKWNPLRKLHNPLFVISAS